MADPLDRLVPAPLSVTDRERLVSARNILAIEAGYSTGRASTSMGGPEEERWARECSEAARTLDELIRRRSGR
jgi:hypothetical protein